MAATKPPPKIQKESIWRTLPRACFGLIAAVVLDVVAMLGYATLLLMDGASPSAFYFAAVVLTPAPSSSSSSRCRPCSRRTRSSVSRATALPAAAALRGRV